MPILSASNRTQARYKLEGKYPTNFGVVQAGNGTNIAMTGETLNYDIKTEQSKVLRSDRGIASHVQVGASANGDLNIEHIYREYDPFYSSVLGSDWVQYGTNGVTGTAIATLTATASTLTAGAAPTGNDAFTGLARGQWFSIIPAAGASQAVKDYLKSRCFKVSTATAPTSTVITLDAATPIDTVIITAPLTGAKLGTSRLVTGTDMWSYTLEMAHEDVSQFRIYEGQIPGKINFKLSVGSIVTGAISFMGKRMRALANTSVMGTPVASQSFVSANATRGVFDIMEGGASVTATTYIKSADITIDGSLRMQDAVGVFGSAGIAPGTFKIGGTVEVYFADAVMYNKFLNSTATSLELPILDVDGNGYVYVFPNFRYTAGKVNAAGLDQDNTLSMTFECDIDNNVNAPTYQKMMAIYRVGV